MSRRCSRAAATACVAMLLALEPESAPVTLDGEELFRVRGTSMMPPLKRAGVISERLRQFADDSSIPVDALRIEPQPQPQPQLTRILAGEEVVMVLGDLDAEGAPRERLA